VTSAVSGRSRNKVFIVALRFMWDSFGIQESRRGFYIGVCGVVVMETVYMVEGDIHIVAVLIFLIIAV
jgi:hypothetical protein